MGTFFDIRLPIIVPGALDLGTRCLDLVDELEAQLSVYRDGTEVGRLNQTAHLGPVKVDSGLFRLLELARDLWEETDGAYDIAAGALSEAWGFFKGPRRVPDSETLAQARSRTGQRWISLDPSRQTVAFERPGVVINLGSIGKGYALDRAADLIRDHWWPTPGLIHGGQSSLFALGSPPWDWGGRWEIALRNPFHAERPLGLFRLRDRGMGTSGASFQRFEANGRLYGHIIDPRTGEPPVTGPAIVTVLAPTAAEADALSTAFYLLGPERTAEIASKRPELSVLFILDPAGDERPRFIPIQLSEAEFVPEPWLKVLPSPSPSPTTGRSTPGVRPKPAAP
jgi:thiamine biosynthesis lipoprotein